MMGIDYKNKTPIVAFRFDDNYSRVHTKLAPLFDEIGVPASICVCDAFVGTSGCGTYAQLKERRSKGWELCQHDVEDQWYPEASTNYTTAEELQTYFTTDLAAMRAGLGDDTYTPAVAVPPQHRVSRQFLPVIMDNFEFMTSPVLGTNSDWGATAAHSWEGLYQGAGNFHMFDKMGKFGGRYAIIGTLMSLDTYDVRDESSPTSRTIQVTESAGLDTLIFSASMDDYLTIGDRITVAGEKERTITGRTDATHWTVDVSYDAPIGALTAVTVIDPYNQCMRLAKHIIARKQCCVLLHHASASTGAQWDDPDKLADFRAMLHYLKNNGARIVTLTEYCRYYTNRRNPHYECVNDGTTYYHRELVNSNIFNHLTEYDGLPGGIIGQAGTYSILNAANCIPNPAGIASPVSGENVVYVNSTSGPGVQIGMIRPGRLIKVTCYVKGGSANPIIQYGWYRYNESQNVNGVLAAWTPVTLANASWKRVVLWLTPDSRANCMRVYFTGSAASGCYFCNPKVEEVNPRYAVGDTDEDGDVVGTNVT